MYLERMNIPDLDFMFSLMNLSKLNYPNRLCCKCHLHLNAERERDGCGNGELFGMKPFACMATAWKEIPSGGSKASNFTGQGQREDYVMGKRAAAHERNASATARAVCSLCDSILSLVGQGSPRQRSRSDFRRRRLIHRCLLARSGEQFSWVKIVVLHSGKGSETKKIKKSQEQEQRRYFVPRRQEATWVAIHHSTTIGSAPVQHKSKETMRNQYD